MSIENTTDTSSVLPVPPVSDPAASVLALGKHGRPIGFWRDRPEGGGSPWHAYVQGTGLLDPDPSFQPKADAWDALPWPGDHIDATMPETERERIASLLDSQPIVVRYHGKSFDRISGRTIPGVGERAAGGWTWPEGLSHYVRTYGLRLPETMIADIEGAA